MIQTALAVENKSYVRGDEDEQRRAWEGLYGNKYGHLDNKCLEKYNLPKLT